MKIVLDKTESEEYFHNALCNGLGYMSGYGLQFVYEDADYKKAKKSLEAKLKKEGKEPGICLEDVFVEILRNGGKLTFEDVENEGDYTRSITLKDVHERVQKTPIDHLNDMINENDDATTADVILQTVFFEDVIFG